MSSEDDTDKPPTSKEEADDARPRPPPEKYDPDESWEWSITEMLAWIIWREIDAVRIEGDDYRSECADKPSGWGELRLRACLKNISPQAAIKELWKTAGEGRIKATALRSEDDKTIDRKLIDIPARLWARLKPIDDPLTGKAMLIDDQGRVYRKVLFRRLAGKELWPKPPPLPEEHAETWPSHLALIQLTESTMWSGLFSPPCAYSEVDALEHVEKQPEPEQTRPAEPELPEPKVGPAPTVVSEELKGQPALAAEALPESVGPTEPEPPEPKAGPQWERAKRYIQKHFPYNEKLAYDRDLKKHFPHGVDDSITTAAVFDKLDKDPDLKAELSGRRPPSMTLINRMLGRRQMS